MKVALIGASGFVGTAVLHELVQRGHIVTAIARNPEKVSKEAGVTAVKADVLDVKELEEILKGHDAVISTYNAGWTNPDLYNAFLKGAKAIQEAVKASGVKRFIVVGGAGSLFIAPGVQLIDTPQFPAEWKPGALAARDYLTYIKNEQTLDWTFLSPAIEMHQGTSGVRKGHYRTGKDEPVFDENGKSIISVEDTAVAIADELEHPKHIKQRFTIAY
ncbi:MAG: NAD(P)-dependent oxidoreductase [Terrimonas sp.]|nr:NAD(P)-dependent oxidoreductase [Terrimonas sp.]OJY93167.1 MAG: histidine kinase [Sphingobacteriales bacterium 40-81]